MNRCKLTECLGKARCATCLAMDAAYPPTITAAMRDVAAERRRQIEAEGWTTEHDDEHATGAMAAAAACYALSASAPCAENDFWRGMRMDAARSVWPWDHEWWKPKSQRQDLVRAAALLVAEIERIDRAEADAGNEALAARAA